MMSHLGIKPDNGGSPPSERRTKGATAARAGVLAQEVARPLTVVEVFILKMVNAEKVMARYMARVRKVRDGEN